ncbi:MAG: hypothetical protein OEV12_13110 [Gammaproteobacteria bacterium]|jgi:hypothetical protein|nr:hypothetical protein [Gammaproteobacteria bacterium]MDH3888977.1 hypothetical protein [Gammaproteobacteria bacterium]MDH3934448.1 hypothetical protein [Gammaproteobacteria bacterium]MDH3987330.1 hypothetical protein [Gammaproteobacteria bacterium]
MLPVKPVMILFATALLTACASSGPAPSFEDSFATDISADGTKFFTYTRRLHKDAKTQGHRGKEKDADSALQKSVQEKLDSSGYCRDGYLALEHYEANGIIRIRGECRDGASDNDRTQFPNQR